MVIRVAWELGNEIVTVRTSKYPWTYFLHEPSLQACSCRSYLWTCCRLRTRHSEWCHGKPWEAASPPEFLKSPYRNGRTHLEPDASLAHHIYPFLVFDLLLSITGIVLSSICIYGHDRTSNFSLSYRTVTFSHTDTCHPPRLESLAVPPISRYFCMAL